MNIKAIMLIDMYIKDDYVCHFYNHARIKRTVFYIAVFLVWFRIRLSDHCPPPSSNTLACCSTEQANIGMEEDWLHNVAKHASDARPHRS